jgi:hypothetical protein
MKTFHVLISTIGRLSLQRMLDSLSSQLKAHDHLTIVFDGVKLKNCDTSKFVCNVHIHIQPDTLGYWGHGVRNKYADRLDETDFIMHADDDDRYIDGAFDRLREVCSDSEDTLYIARMFGNSYFPKDDEYHIPGNVGTPCGIVPYKYNNKAIWGLYGGGDGFFYDDLSKIIKNTVWLPDLIYLIGDSVGPI